MNAPVRDCLVTEYQSLIEILELPDPDDRHVLAAAIKVNASSSSRATGRTSRRRNSPNEGIRQKHPDEFVRDVIDLDSQAVWAGVQQIVDSRTRHPVTADDVLDELERDGLVGSAAALCTGTT
jgi:hypothetical protein